MKNTQKDEILLEAGTNELEVMVFEIAGQLFGINSLKVSQLVQYEPKAINKTPGSKSCIMGTSMFNGQFVSVVNTFELLGLDNKNASIRPIVLFSEFNNRIYRVYLPASTELRSK